MQINIFANDVQILLELGERLKLARIRAGMTQNQLAEQSGVAKSTVERAERGESIQIQSLIKLLRALNCIGGLETLLPNTEATPLENVNQVAGKQRVRHTAVPKTKGFKWVDEE